MPSEQELRLHRCCFTGPRPENLNRSETEVKTVLEAAIRASIKDGYTTFISGMARGVDIWAAQIVLKERSKNSKIKLIAAPPYKGFETRWTQFWQEQYIFILQYADLTRFVCNGYSIASFQMRNEWMVNHSNRVIAVYDGKPGGTRNTIEYAKAKEVECLLI